MKIGLYFGSFNPIHVGHLIIANHVVETSDLDQLWFIISPHNPHKEKQTLLEDYHRLALVKEAIDDNPKFRASDIEFKLEQPNYTVKTLLVLKDKYPNYEFQLIMGEDNLRSLHKWYNYNYLIENYKILVYPRAYNSMEKVHEFQLDQELIDHPNIYWIKDTPTMNISSSHIRSMIKQRKDVRYLLTDRVWKYIDDMGFYGA